MDRFSCLLLILQLSGISCGALKIQPCKLEDLDCLKNSAQNFMPTLVAGIPELEIEPLDIMNVENIKFNLAGLEMNMENIKISGLKNSIIDKIRVDMKKNVIELTFLADVVMKGDYKCKGRLLALPIYGNGLMDITLNKLKVNMRMPFEIIKNADGKEIMNLKSSSFTYEILGNLHFELTNLFDGNKELSDIMVNSINENWREVADLFGISVLEQPMALIGKAIKKCVRSEPLEDIILI